MSTEPGVDEPEQDRTMIAIQLAKIVAFLRPLDALGVLEGAPFFYSNGPTKPPMIPIPGTGMETWDGEPVRLLGHEHHAMLYLGDAGICPAAEGWAVRLLALSVGCAATYLHMGPRGRVALFDGSRLQCQWVWRPELVVGRLFRETTILGVAPFTPAGHLAAVLNFELERPR